MAISSALGGAGAVPIGVVNPFAGANAPAGWLLCFGQAVSRTAYPVLFTTLSTTYGSGDGSTTFNIPDMRGRVVAGEDDMGGTAANRLTNAVSGVAGATLGAVGGNQIMHAHDHVNSATFTGTAASHGHTQNAHGHVVSANSFAGDRQIVPGSLGGDGDKYSFTDSANDASSNTAVIYARDTTATNQTTSITPAGTITMTNATFPPTAGGSSQNVQPTIVLNYIIKAQ